MNRYVIDASVAVKWVVEEGRNCRAICLVPRLSLRLT